MAVEAPTLEEQVEAQPKAAVEQETWQLPDVASSAAQLLARSLGVSVTLADVLHRRGLTDPEQVQKFLEPKLAHLTRPDAMVDRDVFTERLVRAVRENQRICVFGDYDCDGVTSAAIMTQVLRALGGQVVPRLASRFDGGYGVSQAAVGRILEARPAVLVTCDCGSSDHASLQQVRDAGIDVLVLDHHLVPDDPLPAQGFINPHRPDCGFPYKGLASCGLALSLAAALRAELGAQLDLRQLLDLVAIGTVADVAPLDGDNRPLVRVGLAALRAARRPGVAALLEYAKVDRQRPLTAEDIAFRIAPRINAPGRLGPPDLAFQLLLAENTETARAIAARVEQLQERRKEIQQEIEREACEEIEREGYDRRPAIVVGRESWNHGVVGIVAGRLVDRYGVPVVAIGFEGDIGRGSVRGPDGCRLYDALSAAADPLTRFGGHQAAAGVTLALANLEPFREAFDASCERGLAQPKQAVEADPAAQVRLHETDDPFHAATDLERLEPCGEANPAPKVVVQGKLVSVREVTGGHLKLELEIGQRGQRPQRISAFGVALGHRAKELGAEVVVRGRLQRDTWRGGRAVELRIDEVR